MSAGECQTRNANDYSDDEKEDTPPPLDAEDIEVRKRGSEVDTSLNPKQN